MAKTYSCLLVGVDVFTVEIETVVGNGFSGLTLLGLGNEATRDMRERIRAALESIGIPIPARRVIVNITPSLLVKLTRTPLYQLDFPVAASIIYALFAEKKECQALFKPEHEYLAGELSLTGEIKEIANPLIYEAIFPINTESKQICLPVGNKPEPDTQTPTPAYQIHYYSHLSEWLSIRKKQFSSPAHLFKEQSLSPKNKVLPEISSDQFQKIHSTFKKLLKNPKICVSILVAATGKHHILIAGEPGVGKSFALQKITNFLPTLTEKQRVEVKLIHGASDAFARPFRSPHHSATSAALIGGSSLKPGEVSLAHHGVLFLDELTEFPRSSLEALREPLDSGAVCLSRAGGHVRYPANFQLCATTNPCACGYYFSRNKPCRCHPSERKKYMQKLSGPLLDRFCLQVWASPKEDSLATDLFTDSLLSKLHKNKLTEFIEHFLGVQSTLYEGDPNEIDTVPSVNDLNLSCRGENKIKNLIKSFSLLFPELTSKPDFLPAVLNYRVLDKMFSEKIF